MRAGRSTPIDLRFDVRSETLFETLGTILRFRFVSCLDPGVTSFTGPIVIEPTGSWQSWTTVTVDDVPLTAGSREFRVVIDDGDFNINHIDVR